MTVSFSHVAAETPPDILQPPVIIGLFRGTAAAPAGDAQRLRALAAEAALQGTRFGLFSSATVAFATATTRYWSLGPAGWYDWCGPLPDAVMLGTVPRSEADLACLLRLRETRAFLTGFLPSKRTLSKALLDTAVASHVIPFLAVGGAGTAAAIGAFLDRHPRAVVKPSTGGRRGRDVIFLARDGDGIVLRELNRQRRLPAGEALAKLAHRIGDEPWLLQKFVVSRSRDGRAFDVRVHVHKDGAGHWAVVRAYVRLAETGLLVSNTSRGGYQGDLDQFAAGLGPHGPALAERVRRLGIETGQAIDGLYGGHNDELGVDVLVDSRLSPWIVEVNAAPQSRYHEFERARFAVAYGRHAAQRWRSGDWPPPPDNAPVPLAGGEGEDGPGVPPGQPSTAPRRAA